MAISRSKGLLISASLAAALSLGACAHGNHHDVSSSSGGGGDPGTAERSGTVGTLVDTTTDTAGGVLAAAGNTLLGVSDQTNLPIVSGAVGQIGQTVSNLGENLADNGLGGVPVAGGMLNNTVGTADSLVGGLANVTVGDLPVLTGPSGATPLLGVNALPTSGGAQLSNVSLGGAQVLGQAGQTGAVNANINLSPGSGAPNPLGGAGPVGGVVSGAVGAAGGLAGGGGSVGGVTTPGGTSESGSLGSLIGGLTGAH